MPIPAIADQSTASTSSMTIGIERPAGPDQEIQPMVRRADRGQREDDVVVGACARPMRDIADPKIANGFAALERQVAQFHRLMRTIDPAGLQRRMLPTRLAG